MGGARAAGSASASYARGAAGKQGGAAFAGGMAAVGRDAASAAAAPAGKAAHRIRASFGAGKSGAPEAPAKAADGPPAWATSLRRRQTMAQGATIAAQTLKGGDSHGAGSAPNITEKE
jgi:type IV secretion system protein TrbL